MHIEPGVVDGAKMALGAVTGTASVGMAAKVAFNATRTENGVGLLAARSAISTALVLAFFQFLPHPPVGVSEVHLILGTTLFLIFGTLPAAIGLILGLLAQGMFFAPADLPQFGMNVTTLVVPLVAMSAIAQRIIPDNTPYTDLTYGQTLKLSIVFQGGIVAWVAFWVFYGQGFGAETIERAAAFATAYLVVIALEPLFDLAVLAMAKALRGFERSGLPHPQLYHRA